MNAGIVSTGLKVNGQETLFQFFDNPLSRRICEEILNGRTYPAVGIPGEVGTIVDIGANVGAAAIHFAATQPRARIFCFEPVPDTFRLLEQNTRWAGGRIQCRNVGLSNQNARLPMFRGAVDSVTNSVYPNAETSRESFEIVVRDAASALAEAGIKQIDILKVDTEGCEVVIFESLQSYLPEVMVIYLEYHSEQDRLTLDQLLSPTHLLAKGTINGLHRGELCYVSRKWVETLPVTGRIGA